MNARPRLAASRNREPAGLPHPRLPALRLLALLLPIALGGCATIQPWERGTLADYTMRSDRAPLATATSDHVYFSREAAAGGRGVGGGGCGCN